MSPRRIVLALLLASPELDLGAVTTVSGDVQLRARIAKKFLALGGRASVPVFAGESEPLNQHRSFLWLGHEGRGIVGEEERITIEPRGAVEVLARTNPADPTEIVAIGPLTNIARALNRRPDLREAIPKMTIMGGVLGPSHKPAAPAFEYNFGSDAEASVSVLEAGIPTAIVPLDLTLRVFFRPHDLGRLRRSRSALVQTLCDALGIWWRRKRGQATFVRASRRFRLGQASEKQPVPFLPRVAPCASFLQVDPAEESLEECGRHSDASYWESLSSCSPRACS